MKLLLVLIPLSLGGCVTATHHKYILDLTRRCTSIEVSKEITKLKCEIDKDWDI